MSESHVVIHWKTITTLKEDTMPTTNAPYSNLTTEQRRRADAVAAARTAIAGTLGQIKEPTHVVMVAEYILGGIPADEAARKAEQEKKATEEKKIAEQKAADKAAWDSWAATWYGPASQRWYLGGRL